MNITRLRRSITAAAVLAIIVTGMAVGAQQAK